MTAWYHICCAGCGRIIGALSLLSMPDLPLCYDCALDLGYLA